MAKKENLQEAQQEEQVNDNLFEGLEDNTSNSGSTVTTTVDVSKFDDIKFLMETDPTIFKGTNMIVPAYKDELEEKVQAGLIVMMDILPELDKLGMSIDPLVMLLAKWWQIKPARNAVKKMITSEASKRGMTFEFYINVEVDKQLEKWKKIDYGIGRLKAMTTFLKPRHELKTSDKPTYLRIDDKVYIVKLSDIVKAKYDFKTSDERKAYLKSVSEEANIDVVETI